VTVTIGLEFLVGMHVLDAVGEAVGGYGDDAGTARALYVRLDGKVYVRLDGKVYHFMEDTRDGYRSCLYHSIPVLDADDVPLVPFPPMIVEARMRPAPGIGNGLYPDGVDVLYLVNERTGLVVLEIGTENTDDYYPSFISHWVPEGHEPYWLRDSMMECALKS
jgi:hypothetical protein